MKKIFALIFVFALACACSATKHLDNFGTATSNDREASFGKALIDASKKSAVELGYTFEHNSTLTKSEEDGSVHEVYTETNNVRTNVDFSDNEIVSSTTYKNNDNMYDTRVEIKTKGKRIK